MKTLISTVAVVVALSLNSIVANAADGPIGYPGYTWGSLTYPSSVIKNSPENDNLLFQGKIEQGVDWVKFGSRKEFTLNTFASVNYSLDSQGLPYNNKVMPAAGVKVRMTGEWGVADLGVQYVYENRWKYGEDQRSGSGVQAFLTWYSDWNLKQK
jgi:hypothetical protein